ncbi:MAG: NUDIX domain-containing protein [Candidatus Aenigmarchaeota archaeon]|nr:NUDIX domain-containing protein [Candidatus Aenigmarchaeota archaeon]
MKKTITAIVIEKAGKFLLLKRSKHDTFPGLWEFPSGKIEPGENMEESARRELKEETGLQSKSVMYEGKRERKNKDTVTLVHYFSAKSFTGTVKISEEHSGFGWFALEEILVMRRLAAGASPDADSEGKVGMDVLHYFSLGSELLQTTLCLPVDFSNKKIMLGMKKRGFGAGKWNGFGGKVHDGESPEQAAKRELGEEIGIKAGPLEKVCEFVFLFPHVPLEKKWDQLVHVFLAREWKGNPEETKEMKPEWFAFGEIPYSKMWQDDSHWLPLVLKGKKIKARFVFDKDSETIKGMKLKQTKRL